MTPQLLPPLFALFWSSDWAGDVPAPSLIAASSVRVEIEAHPLLGKQTYDGVSARTQGSYDLRELVPSKRLQTLHALGATFSLTGSNEPGAWIGGKVVHSAFDASKTHPMGGEWNWTRDERDYIAASYAARNPKAWEREIA